MLIGVMNNIAFGYNWSLKSVIITGIWLKI